MRKHIHRIKKTVGKPDVYVPLSAVIIFGVVVLLVVYYLGLVQETPEELRSSPAPSAQVEQ